MYTVNIALPQIGLSAGNPLGMQAFNVSQNGLIFSVNSHTPTLAQIKSLVKKKVLAIYPDLLYALLNWLEILGMKTICVEVLMGPWPLKSSGKRSEYWRRLQRNKAAIT